jgi:hypothetical protein
MNQTKELFQELRSLLDKKVPPLQRRKESADSVEYAGTKEAMQGKQKVDGYYFASLVTKPADVRFYFFPLYTHADSFPERSPQLKKFLKGKTCFHVKSLDKELKDEVSEMIEKGVQLYLRDGLI